MDIYARHSFTLDAASRPFRALVSRLFVALLMLLLPCASHADEVARELNGTWQVDAGASDDLDDVADKLNAELNERDRARRRDEKDRQSYNGKSRYQRQMDAVNEMIREDNRTRQWGGPPEVRSMIEAQRIKLYIANRVVVLYDDARRRLLAVNPTGRAYSVSGSEFTSDEIGRSLTFFDEGDLVIETELAVGGRLVERFAFDTETGGMRVTIRQRELRSGPWLEMTRIFEPAG